MATETPVPPTLACSTSLSPQPTIVMTGHQAITATIKSMLVTVHS